MVVKGIFAGAAKRFAKPRKATGLFGRHIQPAAFNYAKQLKGMSQKRMQSTRMAGMLNAENNARAMFGLEAMQEEAFKRQVAEYNEMLLAQTAEHRIMMQESLNEQRRNMLKAQEAVTKVLKEKSLTTSQARILAGMLVQQLGAEAFLQMNHEELSRFLSEGEVLNGIIKTIKEKGSSARFRTDHVKIAAREFAEKLEEGE